MASVLKSRFSSSIPTIKHLLLPLSITTTAPSRLLQPFTQSRLFTQSTAAMSSQSFLDIVKTRRSYYQLEKKSPIDDKKIQDVIEQALLHVPSAFNGQTTRIILLFKDEHDRFWEIVKQTLKKIVPEAAFATSEARINGFQGAYGSVLFFEDKDVVSDFEKNFPIYADKFATWATQSDGMTQFAIWTALEAEGLGANLQHYNPIVDDKVAATWNVPSNWQLNAQLVFGTPAGDPKVKEFKPLEPRFKVYGA